SMGFDTKNMIFSKTPDLDYKQGIYLNEYFYFDSIDCYKARFIIPKINQHGITGIYIDSISNSVKMNLYGENLDSLNQLELLKALKTIKIKFCR
ncbi:MAG TPA: hypothetical protein VF691_13575, partial [Cytophagaceae bacterium]